MANYIGHLRVGPCFPYQLYTQNKVTNELVYYREHKGIQIFQINVWLMFHSADDILLTCSVHSSSAFKNYVFSFHKIWILWQILLLEFSISMKKVDGNPSLFERHLSNLSIMCQRQETSRILNGEQILSIIYFKVEVANRKNNKLICNKCVLFWQA